MRFSSCGSALVLIVPMCTWIAWSAGGDSEKFEQVPLKSIYVAGGGQPNVIQWGFDAEGPYREDLLRFLKLRPTASNIFIVRAKEKVEATGMLIKLEGRATITCPKVGDESRLWLIVFFGFSSSVPNRWTVDSVEVSAKRVRLNYSLPGRTVGGTPDSRPYFALVPLKNLAPGKYDVELRDSGSNEVTLMRKVLITTDDK